MTNTKTSRRKRSPSGVDPTVIAMRLMPEERKTFDQLAQDYQMTDAALAREVYLIGLPIWLDKQQSAASTIAATA